MVDIGGGSFNVYNLNASVYAAYNATTGYYNNISSYTVTPTYLPGVTDYAVNLLTEWIIGSIPFVSTWTCTMRLFSMSGGDGFTILGNNNGVINPNINIQFQLNGTFVVFNNTGAQVFYTGNVSIVNQWVDIAMSYGNNSLVIYLNGTVVSTTSVSLLPVNTFTVGTRYPGGYEWNGYFDEFRIYTSVLPQSAIQSLIPKGYSQYLVVGGGGGAGFDQSAGGGGGGVLTNSIKLISGTVYSVSVGAGGAGGTAFGIQGQNGYNSVLGTLVAYGGGGGAAGDGAAGTVFFNGLNGGSGGGSATRSAAAGGAIGVAGTGVSGQGYSGGIGATDNFNFESGGGGGGAGGVGSSAYGASPNQHAGNGGIGVVCSFITTTIAQATSIGQVVSGSVYFGGGGGGATNVTAGLGVGGYGGGGNGSPSGSTVNGTPNTGGGGGANEYGNSGSGGSGVVILSIPTINYSGVQTGATVSINGSNTVLIWKSGSGSYTA